VHCYPFSSCQLSGFETYRGLSHLSHSSWLAYGGGRTHVYIAISKACEELTEEKRRKALGGGSGRGESLKRLKRRGRGKMVCIYVYLKQTSVHIAVYHLTHETTLGTAKEGGGRKRKPGYRRVAASTRFSRRAAVSNVGHQDILKNIQRRTAGSIWLLRMLRVMYC